MKLKQVLNNLLKCKSPQELIDEGSNSGLKKTLTVFDLIVLGIGAVVGTGIFTIIGSAIAGSSDGAGAGSAVVISMILAAFLFRNRCNDAGCRKCLCLYLCDNG